MPCGDLLSILPGLKKVWKETGKKWIIYQRVNLEYGEMYGAYLGAKYSIKNDNAVPVTMNNAVFEALIQLLVNQEYIQWFQKWDGQSVDYDADLLRQIDTTMPYGNINRWSSYLWPEMATDLSKPWLSNMAVIDKSAEGKILINRTERYNNMLISYHFLKKYGDNVLFVGLPEEHTLFCQQNGLKIERLECKDFFEISFAMKACKLFIGNQSACFQIAEGLKIPRVLEVCKQLPNVIGSGPGFYDFLNQRSLEYYVDKLYNSEGTCTYSGVIKQLDKQSELYNQ